MVFGRRFERLIYPAKGLKGFFSSFRSTQDEYRAVQEGVDCRPSPGRIAGEWMGHEADPSSPSRAKEMWWVLPSYGMGFASPVVSWVSRRHLVGMVLCGALDTIINKVLYTAKISTCAPFDKPFTLLMFLFLAQLLSWLFAIGEATLNPFSLRATIWWRVSVVTMLELANALLMLSSLLFLPATVMLTLFFSLSLIFTAAWARFALGQALCKTQMIAVALVSFGTILIVGGHQLLKVDEVIHWHKFKLIGFTIVLLRTCIMGLKNVSEQQLLQELKVELSPATYAGLSGFIGMILTVTIVWPIVFLLKGSDHGHGEDIFLALATLVKCRAQLGLVCVFVLCMLGANYFEKCIVAYFNCTTMEFWKTFRLILVWGVMLALWYITGGAMGEPWDASCWLRLCGMLMLICATELFYNTSVDTPVGKKDLSHAHEDLPVAVAEGKCVAKSTVAKETVAIGMPGAIVDRNMGVSQFSAIT
jgi:drug/metabolite transporter (DMT)-like permease